MCLKTVINAMFPADVAALRNEISDLKRQLAAAKALAASLDFPAPPVGSAQCHS